MDFEPKSVKIVKYHVYIFVRLLMAIHRWYGFAAQVRIFIALNLTYLKITLDFVNIYSKMWKLRWEKRETRNFYLTTKVWIFFLVFWK